MIQKKFHFAVLAAVLLFSLGSPAQANEVAIAPVVDDAALAPLGSIWRKTNPYRGQPVAIEIGHSAFNQSCARCHGVDANNHNMPAPDLRQLDRTCRRIADSELKTRCMADNDTFFSKSVRHGKIVVGVIHMPPWEGVLKQELAWAIQAFIESQAGAAR